MKKRFLTLLLNIMHIPLHASLDTMNIHNNIMANYLQFGGKSKQAYELYKSMLNAQAPIYVYKGYIHLLFDTANYAHIIQLVPQLDPVFEHDPAIQLIFAQAFEKIGNIPQADERYIKLNDRFKHNQEVAFNAANSYLRRREPENALLVIDGLLNSSPRRANNFIFYFMKAQIYIQLNKKQEALAAVHKSLEMHPRFDKGWLLLALLHEQEGQLNDAIKGYTHFLETTEGNNKDIEQHVLQLVFKQTIKKNPNKKTNFNKQCMDNALRLFEKKEYKKALEMIDQCIGQNPKNVQNKVLKIEILTAMNRTVHAADQVKQWILDEPDNHLWYKALHLLTRTHLDIEHAIYLLHDVQRANPNNLLVALYLADLNTRIDNKKEALLCHKKALKLTKNKALKEKIMFQMAFIHFESNHYKAFKKIIKQARVLKSEYAPLLNIIAYYYTQQEQNLAVAQKLVTQALAQDAENPHYLDTQAMIYLQSNKGEQAVEILEKIAQIIPSDYTILLHLAQAQHHTGKIGQAIKTLGVAHSHAKRSHDICQSTILLDQWKTKEQSNIIASAL